MEISVIVHKFSKSVKRFIALVGAASAFVTLPVLAQTTKPAPSTTNESPSMEAPSQIETQPTTPSGSPATDSAATSGNVVDVAASNSSFKTLTAALKAAGLDKALASGGPYTVFAPTDKAFAALPKGTLEKLLKPENRAALVKILTYHVVEGDNPSSTLKSGDTKTLEGDTVSVSVSSGGVTVNDAKVIQPDIKATNGVIHVIDKVIVPNDLMQQPSGSTPQQPSGGSSK